MPQIQLLGGVSATDDDGRSIDVGPTKCQVLLAALALSPGATLPVDRLVDLVWADDPPRTASKTLQTYVARLRRGLGPDAITRVGAAYRLELSADSIDVARFEAARASNDIAGALAEWSGPPLAGIDAPGLGGAVQALVEQWLHVSEVDLGRLVEQRPADAVAPLTELTNAYPFREGPWGLLMTALYRAGRQADALAAYRRARAHLVDELGLEPGPVLREVETLILTQDERLEPASSSRVAPSGTLTFAFSDIEGSSRLWSEHRRAMSTAVATHDEVLQRLTATNDGYVFSTGGDSFGVAFTRASHAATWADAVHAALDAAHWPDETRIRVRIGLHSGEADERDGDYFGPPVNTAWRVAEAGHGGQTLVSGTTASLLDRSDLAELGRFRLTGVPLELPLFQLGPGAHPPPRTDHTVTGNLPRRLGTLYGRDDDLDRVSEALRTSPIVTLVGPGGIGKTRLALAAARSAVADHPGGAWLVELAEVTDPDDVALMVANVVDARPRPAASLTDAIGQHLADQRALLVLDNCEHVIDGAAELAEALIRRCPDVSVLATSREGLAVGDERIVVVGPLDPSGAAVELFSARAAAAGVPLTTDDDRRTAGEITRRLDGVPLAIEIAAGRLGALSIDDLVALLDDRFRMLTGGRRRTVERHRTLRAAIQWSVDLLTPIERTVFRRLSVFAGSFDRRSASAVAAGGAVAADDVPAVLADLVDRSMVVVDSGVAGRRYRLLETIRQHAAELLAAADETDATAARHAHDVRREVATIEPLLVGVHESDGAARLDELWPNLRAAVDWALATCDHELAIAILRPIALQLFVRRGFGEIALWAERLLTMIPGDDIDARAECLMWTALHYSMTQERERFRALADEHGHDDHVLVEYCRLMAVEDDDFGALAVGPLAAEEMRRRGQTTSSRLFELFTGGAMLSAGRFEEMESQLGGLAETFRAEGPPSFLNWTLFLLGAAAAFQGDHSAADRYWNEVVDVPLPPRTNSPNEILATRAAFRQGRRRESYLTLRRYIDELVDADNMAGVALVGLEYVNMMVELGRLDDAAVMLGHFDETGLLAVEGPGFKVFIEDAVAAVAADPDATAVRARAAARHLHERDALAEMRTTLDALLSDPTPD